ncbi:uncharacterized protein B0H64DRAFT_619 [Chaetomium fimeti]|uniref:Uncharacterized protein n=1 Tax=Chaetomium fimeti TaxID=1854472 RepID=A0AAE0HQ87_9PEZI|nr:hypothetical protein B0H64DRAFT_619 [Chaetomium fimeti]
MADTTSTTPVTHSSDASASILAGTGNMSAPVLNPVSNLALGPRSVPMLTNMTNAAAGTTSTNAADTMSTNTADTMTNAAAGTTPTNAAAGTTSTNAAANTMTNAAAGTTSTNTADTMTNAAAGTTPTNTANTMSTNTADTMPTNAAAGTTSTNAAADTMSANATANTMSTNTADTTPTNAAAGTKANTAAGCNIATDVSSTTTGDHGGDNSNNTEPSERTHHRVYLATYLTFDLPHHAICVELKPNNNTLAWGRMSQVTGDLYSGMVFNAKDCCHPFISMNGDTIEHIGWAHQDTSVEEACRLVSPPGQQVDDNLKRINPGVPLRHCHHWVVDTIAELRTTGVLQPLTASDDGSVIPRLGAIRHITGM